MDPPEFIVSIPFLVPPDREVYYARFSSIQCRRSEDLLASAARFINVPAEQLIIHPDDEKLSSETLYEVRRKDQDVVHVLIKPDFSVLIPFMFHPSQTIHYGQFNSTQLRSSKDLLAAAAHTVKISAEQSVLHVYNGAEVSNDATLNSDTLYELRRKDGHAIDIISMESESEPKLHTEHPGHRFIPVVSARYRFLQWLFCCGWL